MCGGVGFKIENVPESELKKRYSPDLVKKIKDKGRLEQFYWHKDAVLPVKKGAKTQLIIWGNKDKEVDLPKTGWAKKESLEQGRWDWLKPDAVDLPIDKGYEKKVWFDMPQGSKGIVARDKKGENERVYMITEPASDQYEKETKHDRQPVGRKKFNRL